MKNSIFPLLLIIILFLNSCAPKSTTCEICGYIALQKERCEYCGNKIWKESFGISKEEYVRSKQIDWFYIPGGEPNFEGPIEVEDILEGKKYLKDSNWKPSVTKEEIQKHFQ